MYDNMVTISVVESTFQIIQKLKNTNEDINDFINKILSEMLYFEDMIFQKFL